MHYSTQKIYLEQSLCFTAVTAPIISQGINRDEIFESDRYVAVTHENATETVPLMYCPPFDRRITLHADDPEDDPVWAVRKYINRKCSVLL